MSTLESHPQPLVAPLDDANRALLSNVHPDGWRNPASSGTYDLVAIGGGTAGLVSAMGAAGLGARVALVERWLLGGDCLNVGCVPSKALIRSARAIGEARRAAGLGVRLDRVEVDFASVMQRMRERRAGISPHDSASRLQGAGVDVFFGDATFTSARTIDVEGQTLRFNRAVIATGGRPAAPPIAGLGEIPYLTNETLFWLTELPRRLLVIGAGPIGCEMAQTFARLGSAVTLLSHTPQILPREDAGAADIVRRRLVEDGVRLELGATLTQAIGGRDGVRIRYERPGGVAADTIGDQLLVAAGRSPNVEGLGLDAAGVDVDRGGVVVDDRLRTTNARIYAAGDVCSTFKFTHAADAMARIVIQNALFYGRRRVSRLVIPWCTYTDPEVAHVGLHADEARRRGHDVQTITTSFADVDRAVLDDDTDGFVRIHHERGTLLGATIVASHAGEMIGEVVYALTHGGRLSDLSSTIHPYPTQAEALRMAGDTYRRSALTPAVKTWLRRYFRWTR